MAIHPYGQFATSSSMALTMVKLLYTSVNKKTLTKKLFFCYDVGSQSICCFSAHEMGSNKENIFFYKSFLGGLVMYFSYLVRSRFALSFVRKLEQKFGGGNNFAFSKIISFDVALCLLGQGVLLVVAHNSYSAHKLTPI